MIGIMFGLEANRLSDYVMRFTRGTVANVAGDVVLSFTGNTDVNLQANGLNGLDVGVPVAGQDYMFYVIYNPSTLEQGIIASASITYGGVTLPAGFVMVRKISFGIVLRSDGIPEFHAGNWPKPTVMFTGVEGGAANNWFPTSFKPNVWTTASLTPWIPDNARLAWVQIEAYTISRHGSAGTLYIKSSGSVGIPVANVNPANGIRSICPCFPIRVTSLREVQIKATGDARGLGKVLGYSMTEPLA